MLLFKVTNWRRFLPIVAVGGVLTAIGFLLIGWWWGTAFLLLTLFLLCFWVAPRTLIFTLYAVFAIAWISGALIEGAFPGDWKIGQTWRGVAAGLLGFMIGAAIPVLFWYMALVASTKWILNVSETLEMGWGEALKFVARRTFELVQAFMIVENGKVIVSRPPGMLALIGGPGLLVMRPGNAVALERGGKLSRIVGPRVYGLKQFEAPLKPEETKGIVDLRPQEIEGEAEVLTKDGIPLQIKLRCVYQIEPKRVTDTRPPSHFPGGDATTEVLGAPEYPVYEAVVRKAVLGTPEQGWKSLFPWGPIRELRDVVAAYTVDQVYPLGAAYDPDAHVLQTIEDEVRRRFNPWRRGVHFGEFTILEVTVPEDVRKHILRQWATPREGRLKIQEAEAERDAMIALSEGRARAIEQVEDVRLRARRGTAELIAGLTENLQGLNQEHVARSFISVIEELTRRVGQDETVAIRYIEALEAIIESPGPKSLVITSPSPGTEILPLSPPPQQE